MSKSDANKPKTTGKPHRWPKGVSGNPAGRPKDGESWAAIYAAVGNMYTQDILDFIGKDNDLGRMIASLPRDVQLKYLTVIRVYAALLFEPTQGLLSEVTSRIEGKVTDNLDVKIKDELTDDERIARLTAILDAARARRDGQVTE